MSCFRPLWILCNHKRYNTSIFAFCGTVRLFSHMIEHHIYNHMRVADISSSPLTPKHRNNQSFSQAKNACGSFPVCCGTEALLLPFYGIDHYCTTAHFFMSSNTNLGASISDNIFVHGIEIITVNLKRLTSAIVSGRAALCASRTNCQVTPSLMMWRLPFLHAEHTECTGFNFWAEPPPFSIIIAHLSSAV